MSNLYTYNNQLLSYGNGLLQESSGGGGATLPVTTNLLKGDGAGGALAAVPSTDYVIPSALSGKANLSGGNTFNDNQQFNGLIYLEGSTPFCMSRTGKIGLRATNNNDENLGQINISNAWYDANHYGCQMNAKNKATGKYNALRVSHNGVEYFDENDTAHQVAMVSDITTAIQGAIEGAY